GDVELLASGCDAAEDGAALELAHAVADADDLELLVLEALDLQEAVAALTELVGGVEQADDRAFEPLFEVGGVALVHRLLRRDLLGRHDLEGAAGGEVLAELEEVLVALAPGGVEVREVDQVV